MTSSASADYQSRVVRSFEALKDTTSATEAAQLAIPIEPGLGQLVPIGHGHASDDRLIALLARWRETNMHLYPTQFPVTVRGTAAWLRDRVLAVPDRVMFLLVERGGRVLGHAGFADGLRGDRSLKLDNVVRGEPGGPPGIMAAAVRELLRWAAVTLAAEYITCPPSADNERMIRLLCGLGFRDERQLIPLQRVACGERVDYVPHDPSTGRPPDRYQNRLIYRVPVVDGHGVPAGPQGVSAVANRAVPRSSPVS